MPMPSFEQERLRTHWTASTQRAALLRQEEFLTFARPQRRDLSASEMPMGFSKSVCWISPPTSPISLHLKISKPAFPFPVASKKQTPQGGGIPNAKFAQCLEELEELTHWRQEVKDEMDRPFAQNWEKMVTDKTTPQVELWRRCWLDSTGFLPMFYTPCWLYFCWRFLPLGVGLHRIFCKDCIAWEELWRRHGKNWRRDSRWKKEN